LSDIRISQILNATQLRISSSATVSIGETVTFTRGSGWYTIGPVYTRGQKVNGYVPIEIIDTQGIAHVATLVYSNGEIIGLFSKDPEYIPRTADAISGFVTVKPGIQLRESGATSIAKTSLSYSVGSSGTTLIELSDNSDLVVGDYYYSANVSISSYLSITALYPNNSISISGITSVYPDEPIIFQRGVDAVNLFEGTATNTQKFNNKPPDAFAILAMNNRFRADMRVDGNLYLAGTNLEVTHVNGNITLRNLVGGANIAIRANVPSIGVNTQVFNLNGSNGLITVLSDPTASTGIATKNYVDTNDTDIRASLASTRDELTGTINTLTANTTVVYGNVRTIQEHLGFRKGGPGSIHDQHYNELTVTNDDSFASNLFALWGNVSAIAANVLSRTGDGGPGDTASSSMFANVLNLQGRTSSLESGYLAAIGSVSIKGILRPDFTNTRNLGTSALRFATFYANTADVGNVVAVRAISGASTVPSTINESIAAGNLPIAVSGNITVTGNINFNQDIGISGSGAGVTSAMVIYGNVTTGSHIVPSIDNTKNVGTPTNRYAKMYAVTFHGTATAAQYADVAERYHADREYPIGTLVRIGGVNEITQENDDASEHVMGVLSDNPAYLMNSEAGDDTTHPAVAMVGRTPVRVVGSVTKGDRLVSAGNGCARRAQDGEITPFNVVGRALADKHDQGENLLEAVILLTL
jgi:hypothetical protein